MAGVGPSPAGGVTLRLSGNARTAPRIARTEGPGSGVVLQVEGAPAGSADLLRRYGAHPVGSCCDAERRTAEAARRRLETRLEAARKTEAIATLAGGVAHQFNNALSAVTASVDLLDLKNPAEGDIPKYTGYIRSSVKRMARLTSQLLAYARGGKYEAKVMRAGDFVKETMARRNGWTQDKPVFWWAMMGDQMMHQLTYLAIAFAVIRISS